MPPLRGAQRTSHLRYLRYLRLGPRCDKVQGALQEWAGVRVLLVMFLVGLVAVAGCLENDEDKGSDDPIVDDGAGDLAQELNSTIPPIQWNVAEQVDWWED